MAERTNRPRWCGCGHARQQHVARPLWEKRPGTKVCGISGCPCNAYMPRAEYVAWVLEQELAVGHGVIT